MPPLTTGSIADEYVALCHNPLQNLSRWLAEDNHPKAYRSVPSTARMNEQVQSACLATTTGFREHPLRELQSGLDAHSRIRRGAHGLPPRPRAGAFGDEGLRSLRAKVEGSTGSAAQLASEYDGDGEEFRTELSAVHDYYGAKIAAARQSRAPVAVIRTLRNERIVAVRAVIERWQQSQRNDRDRRMLGTLQQRETRPILRLRPSALD